MTYKERRAADLKEASAAKRAARVQYPAGMPARRAAEVDIEARRAEIPKDTRGLTAKLFGDPVFERSALYWARTEDQR